MKLKEFINIINTELTDNLKREIIQTSDYTYEYDTEKGRKVYERYTLMEFIKTMPLEITDIDHWIKFENSERELHITNIPFKLRKKQSGLISDWSLSNRMTIAKIEPIEPIETAILDMELSDLIQYEKDRKEAVRQAEEQQRNININNFLSELNKVNINIEDFKHILKEYKNLTYMEKHKLNLE